MRSTAATCIALLVLLPASAGIAQQFRTFEISLKDVTPDGDTIIGRPIGTKSSLIRSRCGLETTHDQVTPFYPFSTSADGLTVVGTVGTPDGNRAYRWTLDGGFELIDLGVAAGSGDGFPHGSEAIYITDDARFIVGSVTFPDEDSSAYLWDDGDITILPGAGGAAYAVSDDGLRVVGSKWTSEEPLRFAIWTNGALQTFGSSATENSQALAVTPDDSVVVGYLDDDAEIGVTDLLILLAEWGPCEQQRSARRAAATFWVRLSVHQRSSVPQGARHYVHRAIGRRDSSACGRARGRSRGRRSSGGPGLRRASAAREPCSSP